MKINITIENDVELISALLSVARVIEQGKISDSGKKYCYVTTFKDGIGIYADTLKSGNLTFRVFMEK